jgi:hypothetical protein
MICPKCGFDNPGGSFCGKCGSPLPAQSAPVYQPPAPKPKNKKMLMMAIAAVVVVIVVVLAAVFVFMPKASSQSAPQSTLSTFLDGASSNDAAKLIDATILHFDTANRSLYLSSMTGANITMYDVEIISMEDIPVSSAPADIKKDVTNFTNAIQAHFGITIQESQFVKATVKNTSDSDTMTSYLLLSKVDGKWYFDIFANYLADDWAKDRSMGDKGESNIFDLGSTDTIDSPIGTFVAGTNNSGTWNFQLSWISSTNVRFTDCKIQLSIGGHTSIAMSIPSSLKVNIPVSAGTATSYDLTIVDSGTSGYLSSGDQFKFGPIGNAIGKNAYQPMGSTITVMLTYTQTNGAIAVGFLTLTN